MSANRIPLLSLLLPLAITSCSDQALLTESGFGAGMDDNYRVKAEQTSIDLTQNDGNLPVNGRIRFVVGSRYDQNLTAGSDFPASERVPYTPKPDSTSNEPFPEADRLAYEIRTEGGEFVAGPIWVHLDVVPSLVVDGIHGQDHNNGSSESPLKTITRALELSSLHCTIQVKAGLYDEMNGEHFPLLIDSPMTLHGDPEGRGRGGSTMEEHLARKVSGSGIYNLAEYNDEAQLAIVIDGNDVTLNGFQITTATEEDAGVGLLIKGRRIDVLRTSFNENFVAIINVLSGDTLIRDCDLSQGLVGAIAKDAIGRNRIRSSKISENITGVQLENVNAFDLGTDHDHGQNLIINNYVGVDVTGELVAPQDAVGNTWNAIPLIMIDSQQGSDEPTHDVRREQAQMIDSRMGVAIL